MTRVRVVDRHEVQRMVAAGAQLVDVLNDEEWEHSRLPGAVHIALEELAARAPVELRTDQPVITYCYDSL